jgi:AsmA protein
MPSIRGFAAWIGAPLEGPQNTLGALHIKGRLALIGTKAKFTDAEVGIDAVAATGNVALDSSGAKPKIDGKLAIEKLVLDPYFPAQPAAGAPNQAKTASAAGADLSSLTALLAADANLDLSVSDLRMGYVQVSGSTLAAGLEGGRLTVDLTQFGIYSGNGHGKVVLDASHPESVGVAVTLNLAGFDALALMHDAADFDRLSGTGTLDATIASRGKTQRELIEGAQGKGRIDMSHGVIKGIDLAAMVLHVASAFTLGDSDAKTEFSEMGGSFTIAKGVVSNNDLSLKSPLLHVHGEGTVNLASHMVDYRVTPKFVTPVVGQLGLGAPGFMVPVIVRGPWDNLHWEPDVAGMIERGLMAPVDVLEDVVEMPGKLLGGDKKNAPADGQKKESVGDKAINRLKGLFGR